VENAAVLCDNHRERVTQIWTSPSEEEEEEEEEEKEKEKERESFWPSGNFLARYFRDAFSATGCVCYENTQRWTGFITAYKLAVFEILRDFFVLAYITRPRYPYI